MKIIQHCFLCYIPQQLRAACSIQTIPIDGALCCSRPAHAPVYIARIALHRVSGAGALQKGSPSGEVERAQASVLVFEINFWR